VTLAEVLDGFRYKPGWLFSVPDRDHLAVGTPTLDSKTFATKFVTHVFGVPRCEPPEGWIRWLFDRVVDIDRHEAGEFFTVCGSKPYYPNHGRQGDPYVLRDRLESP